VLESLQGIWFGQVAAVVLAVLTITSEYSTGMIRTTFAANPRRRGVLLAKTAVVSAVVLVVGVATAAACFQIGQTFFRRNGFTYENGYPAVTLADHDALRAVLGTALCLGVVAVFALALGSILRHTAAAITVLLATILTPPIASNFLPDSFDTYLEKYSLLGGSLAVQQTVGREGNIPLSPGAGLLVVAA